MKRAARIALALWLWSSAARADLEDPVEAPAPDLTTEPRPLPDFMRRKRRMTASDLATKREGGYFTGLVVVDYGISREGSSLYVNFNHPF